MVLRANPGGQISPNEVIGREQQIRRLWDILERQSLVLSAERRMGKTCIVKNMKWSYSRVNAAIVTDIVDNCLTDPLNRWDMQHYRERIDNYYKGDKRSYALNLLDILAVTNQPLRFDELFNRLKIHIVTEDSEMARDVLTLLQRDHYVIQERDGAYHFRFPMIQRYWRLHRGLTE